MQVTKADPAHRDAAFHAYPSFLPDGRHFLFLGAGGERGSAVYVGSLDAKPEEQTSRRLVATGFRPQYVPSADPAHGHLLFIHDDTLMSQPFDVRRLEVTGEPLPVADKVMTIRTDAYFSASENGVLAYRSGATGSARLGWFDRHGSQIESIGEPGVFSSVALSPDGARLAFSRREHSEYREDVWVSELSLGGASTRLTNRPGSLLGSPVWSPDGSRIVYTSRQPTGLFVKLSSGVGDEQMIVASKNRKVASDWSRTAHCLLYTETDPKTKSDIWVLPEPGAPGKQGKVYLRTDANESQGVISPDGRWVAYVSDDSGRPEVYVRPFPDASGGKWMVSNAGGAQPRWRADGRELFYISRDRKMMSVEVRPGGAAFRATTPSAMFTAPVPRLAGMGQAYAVSADGKRFVFVAQEEETAAVPITVVLNWTAGWKR